MKCISCGQFCHLAVPAAYPQSLAGNDASRVADGFGLQLLFSLFAYFKYEDTDVVDTFLWISRYCAMFSTVCLVGGWVFEGLARDRTACG